MSFPRGPDVGDTRGEDSRMNPGLSQDSKGSLLPIPEMERFLDKGTD